jgi:hypothetical protein
MVRRVDKNGSMKELPTHRSGFGSDNTSKSSRDPTTDKPKLNRLGGPSSVAEERIGKCGEGVGYVRAKGVFAA